MSTCLLSRLQFEWLISVALEYMAHTHSSTHTLKTPPSFVIRILVGYRTHSRQVWEVVENVLKHNSTKLVKGPSCVEVEGPTVEVKPPISLGDSSANNNTGKRAHNLKDEVSLLKCTHSRFRYLGRD